MLVDLGQTKEFQEGNKWVLREFVLILGEDLVVGFRNGVCGEEVAGLIFEVDLVLTVVTLGELNIHLLDDAVQRLVDFRHVLVAVIGATSHGGVDAFCGVAILVGRHLMSIKFCGVGADEFGTEAGAQGDDLAEPDVWVLPLGGVHDLLDRGVGLGLGENRFADGEVVTQALLVEGFVGGGCIGVLGVKGVYLGDGSLIAIADAIQFRDDEDTEADSDEEKNERNDATADQDLFHVPCSLLCYWLGWGSIQEGATESIMGRMMEVAFPTATGRPHVKICGITRREDGLLALELGAAFIGMILTSRSPRHVPEAGAVALAAGLRASFPEVRLVGVFTNEPAAEIARLARLLDLFAVQVHGPVEELKQLLPAGRIIPAAAIRDEQDAERLARLEGHEALLADAFSADRAGGTGRVFDHRLVQPLFQEHRVFVAGGLKPENIVPVLGQLSGGPLPYAFDLSSGIEEAPGVKSHERLRAFFESYSAALAAHR